MDNPATFGILQHQLTRPSSQSSEMDLNDSSSNLQSISSTPPTSIGDEASSVSSKPTSDSTILGQAPAEDDSNSTPAPNSARSRRDHKFTGTYNDKILAGRSVRKPQAKSTQGTPHRASVSTPRVRTISGDTLVPPTVGITTPEQDVLDGSSKELVAEGIDALNLPWSPPKLPQTQNLSKDENEKAEGRSARRKVEPNRRISTRSAGIQPLNLSHTLSSLSKRARNQFEAKLAKGGRELKRLADTDEYAKIEKQPIFHTVWANGKFVPAGEDKPTPRKRAREDDTIKEERVEEEKVIQRPIKKLKGPKKYLTKGFFAGQDGEEYWSNKYKRAKDAKINKVPGDKPNGILPLPIYAGDRILQQGHDFKLPFWVCNPLPAGQPKPDEWRRMPKNRFVGDAQAAWKKSTLFEEFTSRCICQPDTGCDDDCQNRIMLYECDENNCIFKADKEHCNNQPFADLGKRKNAGGKYNIGVEVIKTTDRGYGVRSNRTFRANQIITEYTGEIITEQESDKRMNEKYINNSCYYLMSFDQNTILDATEKGSIARFVNHSCEPNCRMVKWVVSGKPRMALFAGRDIMTGEELTYDYNFDPFSAKNVQECRCGADSCRGVLGPRPKDPKFLKPVTDLISTVKTAVTKGISKGKRKLQELLGDSTSQASEDEGPTKKRKIKSIPSALRRGFSKSRKEPVTAIKQENISKTRRVSTIDEKRKPATTGSRNSSLTMVNTEDGKSIASRKSTSSLQRIKKDYIERTPRAKSYESIREDKSFVQSTPKSGIVVLKTGSRTPGTVARRSSARSSLRLLSAAESLDADEAS